VSAFGAHLRRVAWIVRVLVAHFLAYQLRGLLPRWPWLARRLPPAGLSGPERLSRIFEDLGGTFLKLGQMLALQPDILSLEYCNALFNLMDRVAPFGYDQVERVFREDLGQTPDEIFDSFDRQALATASIGQVHVAFLDGRKVAVKVQRPAVDREFAGDIRLMTAAVAMIRRLRLKSFSWMLEPMGEFIGWTREELDYRNEARYIERLRRNAVSNACEHVPAVEAAFTTRRILVAEFLEGVTVLNYLRALESQDEVMVQRLKGWGFDPSRFARHMIDNFLGDAFRHGIFHADLHPANLMILPDNVVGYIDFGITGVISHYSRYHLVMMTLAYTRADPDGMCASFLKVSEKGAGSDIQTFHDGLKRMADTWYEQQGKQRKLRKNFTLVMLDMLRLSRTTGIFPERDVIKYIRSAIAIDGLITRFAPGFNVGQYLEEVCARALRQEARAGLFDTGRMVDWTSASAHLLRDGAFRAVSAFERLARGETLPARPADTVREGRGGRQRALHLSAVACSVSVLMTLTGQSPVLGVNLFTAEALLVAASLVFLLRTMHRLA
jgi:ubiquinone biosynthesis protein